MERCCARSWRASPAAVLRLRRGRSTNFLSTICDRGSGASLPIWSRRGLSTPMSAWVGSAGLSSTSKPGRLRSWREGEIECAHSPSRVAPSSQLPSALRSFLIGSCRNCRRSHSPSPAPGFSAVLAAVNHARATRAGEFRAPTGPTMAAPTRPERPVPLQATAVDDRCPHSPMARTAARRPPSADPQRSSHLPARG